MSRYSGSCRGAYWNGGADDLWCRSLGYTSCLVSDQCEWVSLLRGPEDDEDDGHHRASTFIAATWLGVTVLVMWCIHEACIKPKRRRQRDPSPTMLVVACLICLFLPCGPLLMWLPFVCDCCYTERYHQIQYAQQQQQQQPGDAGVVLAQHVVVLAQPHGQQPVMAHAVPVAAARGGPATGGAATAVAVQPAVPIVAAAAAPAEVGVVLP
jgi:hypothetical protein